MPLIATAGKTYTPAPEGTHQAVCVDVIDKGLLPNKFKEGTFQHKVDLAWQINETRDDGKRFLVFKRYTLSLNEKSNLRHDLESWRGRPFTTAELAGFDVESVIGINCLVNVQHNVSGDKTYSNVKTVMALPKGMQKMFPEGYERAPLNPETDDAPPVDASSELPPLTDEDIPF